jgi:F-type H+-transporting ATPase subunit gamma
LCGGFNTNIVREARRLIKRCLEDGKTVKILCVGRKGRDQLRRDFGNLIIDTVEDIAKPRLQFENANDVSERIHQMFKAGEFDVCTIIYARFQSAMSQFVTAQQLIPFVPVDSEEGEGGEAAMGMGGAVYEYEPDESEILAALLPRNLAVQIFKALLENQASEHGARMTAMDSATRNAGDMISDLTKTYNRTRQAVITNELIEIISAKEAM